MARENYSYKKFQREQAQKKKREEKLQRKLDKKNRDNPPVEAASAEVPVAGTPPAETPAE